MNPKTALVVLNWNNAPDTLACLHSLKALEGEASDLIVVDNGSSDDSVDAIRAAFPDVPVLETHANLGYAGGNNVGIRHALERGADCICILNNDTQVEPGFLDALVGALEADATAGVATPLIVDASQPDRVWSLGAAVDLRTGHVERLHAGDEANRWRDSEPFEVDSASGAAMLVRREVFEQVGLMGEDFFLYFEEIDWCLRVRRSGYRVVAVPGSRIQHKVSATIGAQSSIADYYMERNIFLFLSRNTQGFCRLLAFAISVARLLVRIVAHTVRSDGGRRTARRNVLLWALRDALRRRWGPAGPHLAIS